MEVQPRGRIHSLGSGMSVAPEVWMLAGGAVVVGALLAIGKDVGPVLETETQQERMAQILTEWPRLGGPDSLLGMQAVLRFVLCWSAIHRHARADDSPFVGVPSIFFLLAAIARVVLLVCSARESYYIDGPLGGNFDLFFELSAVPMLIRICRGCLGSRPVRTIFVVVGLSFVLAGVAGCNRLSLAGRERWYLNMCFSFQHLLEMFAAAAFLARTLTMPSAHGVFPALSLLLLPLQQYLSAYFLVFAISVPSQSSALCEAGYPLEMLLACGFIQVGLYCLALALHLAARQTPHVKSLGNRVGVKLSEKFCDEGPSALLQRARFVWINWAVACLFRVHAAPQAGTYFTPNVFVDGYEVVSRALYVVESVGVCPLEAGKSSRAWCHTSIFDPQLA
eukprot:CAMPEP_0194549024 /NCGR_PEP_ID=MMETSP0253-20130528/94567_1 /TAXON_ID=2966 /ORGANISM="Noctiluca scintillans" /LENGTH=392 /DNA_ID=CAMNT_0039396407 /DNA_START=233 /DNA_END=1410 /DNA_ORIENTATION=-